ncbi:STAS/SEC14 domain-containing protein [Marivirga harenae]|uniref:STAS/SEC14 domain-containing protein n=1 Tax=Marivirga harenae TaxID=2010992 RepID=UPI0026E08196|nr:STAS/SEC14 domain-containing protein [Marivirga harenae]WKV13437.1 STAS/SEC14 domain-containing protein [Marivirga harenae]
MKSYAIVDSTRMPIITVTFTGEKSTDENFQMYLDGVEKCYDDRKTIAIIFDASNAVIPKLSHQKKQATWLSQHWKLMQNYCLGTAYVIPSTAIRAVLKMIFSFQNQPVPYKIVSNLEEAESWIEELNQISSK